MRGLVPRLGRGARVVLAADLLSAVGTGMTLPFKLRRPVPSPNSLA
ncbi:MAG TPA: hypothetical protein VFQ68_42315 [Streptosporangiaceae bacterium]|nr:hypothetical protein [Streptosporangiaceae bacterium]